MNSNLSHLNPNIQKTLQEEKQHELRKAKLIIDLAENALKNRSLAHGNIISAFLEEKAEPHIQKAEDITDLMNTRDLNIKRLKEL